MTYTGFKNLTAGGMSPALAAFIGRRKYGAQSFNQHAAKGEPMKGVKPKGKLKKKGKPC